MKRYQYLVLVLLVAGVAQLLPQSSQPIAEDNDSQEPLFGREKIERIKKLPLLPKKVWQRLLQHKRCLITGPCTKKEMAALKKDVTKVIIATIAMIGLVYSIKHQRKVIIDAGLTPGWIWQVPFQYLRIRQGQVKKAKQRVIKLKDHVQRAERIFEGVSNEGIEIKHGKIGTVTVRAGKKKSEDSVQTWGKWWQSWWESEEASSQSDQTVMDNQSNVQLPESNTTMTQNEEISQTGWSSSFWSWLGYGVE